MSLDTVHGLRSTSPPPGPIQVYLHHIVSALSKTSVIIYINGGTMYKCTSQAVVGSVCMQEVVSLREDE